MMCRLCSWICDRFCPPALASKGPWDGALDWEEDFAAPWEPAEGEAVRQRWAQARSLVDSDPAAALAIYVELAEGGSPFSMLKAGSFYERGRGTAPDSAIAEDFYRRALSAGSWRATLRYAHLLFKRGADDCWPSTLRDGVDNGFIPAFFWLGWYSYKRAPRAKTAREVRHLLETAAAAGHPGARLVLVRWAMGGKFGLREIPRGFREMLAIVRSAAERESDEALASA